jgi:hypothetical protein
MKKYLLAAISAVALAGCSSGVLPMGPGQYTIETTGYGSPMANRSAAIREANAYCAQQGRTFSWLDEHLLTQGFSNYTTFNFTCLPK